MPFLPDLPTAAGPALLFSVLLLGGLAGGELAHRALRLPRLSGYVLVGIALGESGVGLVDAAALADVSIFVDIALGVILFELGRRLNLDWLARDRWLLATALLESALAFALVFAALVYFGVRPIYAAAAAAVAPSTSPAVLYVMARELRAEGQVTERALHLSALNSLIAALLATTMLSWLHHEYRAGWTVAALHPLYLIAGSLALAWAAARAVLVLVRSIGRAPEAQFALLLGTTVAAVGLARMLELSVLLALLGLGVLVRALDRRSDLVPVDPGRVAQVFFVVMFVLIGASVPLSYFAAGGALAAVYILARFAGKSIAVLALTPFSGVRRGAAGLLCLALTPMSAVALALVQYAARTYPEFEDEIAPIVLAAVLVLELVGPIAVQFAFNRSGEAAAERER